MKNRLNILCFLVVLVLGYSISESIYQFSLGVSMGARTSFEEGYEAGRKGEKPDLSKSKTQMMDVMYMKHVALTPDVYPIFNDSVLNEKTGEYVPAMYSQMLVSVKTKQSIGQTLTIIIFSMINLFAVVVAVVIFILIIVSINKSKIFIWRNVYCLRWLGAMLILSFICTVVPTAVTSYALSDVFSIKGYDLHLSELVSITNLVLGLSSLIVGEIFAIGLRMKEEQELTI
ncbi:DUF2975 domain-containing protein [Bacteroides sp. 51]|uniref:DUF2975 domain-containing protein n=1 Tax=Bacteroides sp. 51 TaxID=2302938 RepID=UPI0013D5D0F1|nr:DUF2975 domain-containing protein [Bacteroides sp. 51]NDV82202.1 DUF2975 domain-containing protein [Bacteroides sp. 51]